MAIRMAALVRSKNGEYTARKAIPKDVQEAYARLYGVRWEAQLKLPAGTSSHDAKARLGEWLAEVGCTASQQETRTTSSRRPPQAPRIRLPTSPL